MRLGRPATTASFLVALLAACSDSRVPPATADTAAAVRDPRVERRDSAGIEIVTTREPTWAAGAAWQLAPAPRLDVTDSAYSVMDLIGAARLPDGAIAIAAQIPGEVVLIDSTGKGLRRLHGRASGRPFRQLSWIGTRGDTVLAYDLADHRLVRLGRDGSAGVVELRTVAASSFTPLRPLGLFSSGSIAAASGGGEFPFDGEEFAVRQDSAVLLRYAPSGRVRDTLAIVPWGESFGVAESRGSRRIIVPLPRPYGHATTALAAGDRLYVGTGERYEIAVHDTAGRPLRLIRIPSVADSITPAAVDSFRARARRRAELTDSTSVEWLLAAALDSAPFPAVAPAYERFLVDAEGALWVLDGGAVTREAVTWRVFAPDGRYLGVVPMPARFVVHEIGRDYVLGVWMDDGGRQRVRLYDLLKPAPPPAA